ncbi:MAG: ATP-binding cassette domain-containing protein [Sandaracinaceae bacterium]
MTTLTMDTAVVPPPPPIGDFEDLLSRLVLATGSEPDRDALRAAARCTHPGPDGDLASALVAALDELGLRGEVLRGTVAEAAAAVGPEHPVVVLGEGTTDWVVLTDRRGRTLEVETPSSPERRWLRRGAVAALVDPAGLGARVWVAIDPPPLRALGARDEQDERGAPPPTPLARLRALMRLERHDLAVVLVYAIGVGVLTLATPIAVQALVNTVAFGTLLQPLAVLAFLLLVGLAFAAVLRALQAWVVEVLQRRIFLRFVADLSHRLPRVRLSAFDAAHGPELLNRFFDVFTVQKASSSLLLGGLEIVLTALVGALVLAFYHPILLAFDVLLVLLVFGILFVLGRGATKTAVKESKSKYEVASWLEEVARHPAAFKLAGGPALARDHADRLASKYLVSRRDHWRVVFRQLVGALALQAFASAGVLGIGGWLVIERQLTLGQLVAAELIVTAVVASFAKVGKHLETSYDLLAALDKIGQLIDLPTEPSARTATLPTADPDGTRLLAEGVHFAYGNRRVFEDVSLELAAGDRVALSGDSGAGASTLLDVLTGLRSPRAGRVLVDGVDVSDLHRDTLRRRTALVRGTEIVVGSIVDNVVFGRAEVDIARVRVALEAVDLLDEIAALPEGLHTSIHPGGAPLSSSQAVRLSLARALAGQPKLLVIDRALDGLDDATRDRLLDVIFRDDAPWTLLVVSRDTNVRARCSRRLLLEDGALKEVTR